MQNQTTYYIFVLLLDYAVWSNTIHLGKFHWLISSIFRPLENVFSHVVNFLGGLTMIDNPGLSRIYIHELY
jgi:hypothetical protein